MTTRMIACVMYAAILGLSSAAQERGSASREDAAFRLPPLPYAENALEPVISARTIAYHYGKHHGGYVDKLNALVKGTPYGPLTLEKIIKESKAAGEESIYNNAAQVWNHTFFWNGMKPDGGGKPAGPVLAEIEATFGTYDAFRRLFVEAALQRFGSGYVWLMEEGGKLVIQTTSNADTPMAFGKRPLLTCDLWEHAYYLDHQNERKQFVEGFLDRLVNWDYVQAQLK